MLTAAFALVLTSCWWGGDDDDTEPPTTTAPDDDPGDDAPDGPIVTVEGAPGTTRTTAAQLGLRLSEGSPLGAVVDPVSVVDGTPLSPDEIAAIFDRLPDWVVPTDDQVDFNRPVDSLKPPLVGDTVDSPFPPPPTASGPDEPDPGPLEVLRYQPEGAVDLAPFLSVTFDQPMVPLATLDQLDATDVPVVVTPTIEGRWRWIGTRTLRFELVPGLIDRLPAATNYTATVPAGTTAANGATLAESVTWTFSTPTPTITRFSGESDSLPLAPVWVAVFDQRVDPAAVLETVSLSVAGRDQALRLATDAEIEADEDARDAVERALDDRAVAFTPTSELPPDTALTITIGPGTPSAEGPLLTPIAATYQARTFGSLRIEETECGYGGDCEPGSPFSIRFSNRLDPLAFSADQVAVDPEIPGLRINVFGNMIELNGATEGRTTYRVTLAGGLRDIFGQTLGDDAVIDFRVGSAPPSLSGLEREWITTDPTADRPLVSMTTVNHDSIRVVAWAVDPGNLTEYRNYLDEQWRDEGAPTPDWPVVFDEIIEIDGEPDRYVETAIDLSPAFDLAGSQLVVRVEPTRSFSQNDDDYWRNRPRTAWVQSTTLGIDAFFDNDELLIWTTDLATGEPVGGVPVELVGDRRIATTDDDGIARLELGNDGVRGLWANAGGRTSFLIADWYDGWTERSDSDEGRWYIFDDRGIYRPGETVRITGWVRRFAWSEDAQLALYGDAVTVGYTAWDPQGNELASGSTDLNALGGFNLTIDLPDASNLGHAWVEFRLDGRSDRGYAGGNHSFQIQEFRTPEFEVTARAESPPPYFTGQPATVAVDAEYFAGGPLPDADVSWLVSTRETSYSPPNWDDFTFGIWQPWWFFGGFEDDIGFAGDVAYDDCFDCGPFFGDTEYEVFEGRTDAGGTHYLQIDFDGPDVDLPTTVTAEATVFDVNRQAWASRTDLLVHSAELYVGLRSDRAFVERGTPLRIDAVITTVDGTIVAGRDFDVTAGRLEWVYSNGNWVEQVADEQTCSLTSTGDAYDQSMRCEFSTEVGGTYRITGIVDDGTGHRNRTELTQWVSGGRGRPERDVTREEVLIVPDRETHQPGDTAELLVQAPFAPAHGLVTVIRHGIITTETFEAEDGSAIIEVPIEDQYIPNVTVQVDMVGSDVRTSDDGVELPELPHRTAYATGTIDLSIPPLTRALDVTATPADAAVEPGDDTTVTVEVRDAAGDPVAGADVAIVVVDEAVLSLTGYDLADPLDVFYRNVWSNVRSNYMRSTVQLARIDLVTEGEEQNRAGTATPADADFAAGDDGGDMAAEEMADDSAGGSGSAIDVRSDFDALAVYAPDESTGADGTVTVDVPLPDNLTRYRVMAVAIDGADHFGKGESTITARLPLQIRPSAPRFLNFGDRFEFPVVVQNQTGTPLDVDVAIQVANLELTGVAGRRVTVPANDRIEVRFPVTTDEVGTARYRVVAVSGAMADAAAGRLPVYTPATAEAFATYGVVDDGAIGQPILAPSGVFPQFGGLEVNTSSTALQALTDAVLYLHDYRYESSDGYASRIMAVAALRDVLDAFEASGLPDASELNAKVRSDIERLAALQNDDGGWPYWQRGRSSIPWQSIQATHALVLAERAGYQVPSDTLARALQHLASIEEYFPREYGEAIRNTLSSYALYVRAEAGQRDVAKATALYERVGDELGMDAIAWLWPSIIDEDLRDEIERLFVNRAVETPGAATFATDYGEDAYLIAHSDRRTDGIILDALITETPDSDLIAKVVAGLLGNQTRGRWNNAHENAFILIALHRYFETFESVTPDFVARVWLGDLYAAEHEFHGRTTDRAMTLVPTTELISAGDSNLVLSKDGDGRLYYRLGLRYAPSDLELDARDEGFVVDRVYEAVDDPADVTRADDGTWLIRAGAKVRVRLTMVADARRTHVALIDPMPAGLESINPALAVSQTTPPEDDVGPARWFWWWNWFEHQNLRDDRAEAFTSYLPGGTYEYTYLARATTPGEFVVPPTRAEEIYAPEVFGRSATDKVIIE
jgi:uncharacterized protein YfaS (alpha-2-macroglobulin family)